ncbi:trypsin-like serine peptidase [Streptomyces turgidiscabies]|uniref:trypsin-like serine peptidase n=1 Tax=Streptomyces turgidiscabies TaxID=85558 RepID=UPI0027D79AD9|nr:hypothetical protein [Streptomyces turgidiscabies]
MLSPLIGHAVGNSEIRIMPSEDALQRQSKETFVRSLRHAIIPLAAATVLALIGVGTAEAAPAPAEVLTTGALAAGANGATSVGHTARLSGGATVDSASDAGALARFWTPERMANAVSLDKVAASTRPDAAKALAPTGKPGTTPAARARSGTAGLRINESAAVGRVFFTNPSNGGSYACSASALNSDSKQMVVTAGHCVHGGSGGTWMTNWVYVPRYRSGARPFGTFAAKQMRTFKLLDQQQRPQAGRGHGDHVAAQRKQDRQCHRRSRNELELLPYAAHHHFRLPGEFQQRGKPVGVYGHDARGQ